MQANQGSGTGSCVLLYLPHAAGCYANTTACVHSMMYCLISGTCCLYLLQLIAPVLLMLLARIACGRTKALTYDFKFNAVAFRRWLQW
jgi:hypothetical protein